MDKVIQVPLQLFTVTSDACSAHDHAHILGDVHGAHGVAYKIPVFTLDTPGDPAGTRIVRHQDHVASCETDEGGEGCPLVAAFFLLYLNDQFLAFLERILDAESAGGILGGIAEVVTGNFFQWQKAVTVSAVINKGSFEAGLDAGNFALVDVGFFLTA